MIVVAGELRVGAQHTEAIKPYMLAMMEATRAEAGCLHFAYFQDAAEPRTFYVAEAWETRRQLDRHAKTPHWRTWRRVWGRYGVRLRHLTDGSLRAHGGELVAVAIIPPEPPAYPDHTLTAVTRTAGGVHEAHCLAHRRMRSYGTAATAIDGAEQPAEWCAACELSARPPVDRQPPPGLSKAGVVWGMFDATGVPDDAGMEAPPDARRTRRRSPTREPLRAVDDPS